MISACREAVRKTLSENRIGQTHPGLILQRGLEAQENEGLAKQILLENVISSSKRLPGFYQSVFNRYKDSLNQSGCETCCLQVKGRLAVGLSTPSPLEIGLTLHHTYGVPYIPGSALKGLCAHYCKEVWGSADPGFNDKYHKVIFGTGDDSGHIYFYDAWLTPDSLRKQKPQVLNKDIINVHQNAYYTSKPKTENQKIIHQEELDAFDTESPIPLGFFSVTGEFLFAVSCDNSGAEGREWSKLAIELLTEALQNWGVGAKTNSGYGRMIKK